jgi:hypothetical protein
MVPISSDESMRTGRCWNSLDLIDFEYPKVRSPAMKAKQLPVSRFEARALSEGALVGGEFCVLVHPARLTTNVTKTGTSNPARYRAIFHHPSRND